MQAAALHMPIQVPRLARHHLRARFHKSWPCLALHHRPSPLHRERTGLRCSPTLQRRQAGATAQPARLCTRLRSRRQDLRSHVSTRDHLVWPAVRRERLARRAAPRAAPHRPLRRHHPPRPTARARPARRATARTAPRPRARRAGARARPPAAGGRGSGPPAARTPCRRPARGRQPSLLLWYCTCTPFAAHSSQMRAAAVYRRST